MQVLTTNFMPICVPFHPCSHPLNQMMNDPQAMNQWMTAMMNNPQQRQQMMNQMMGNQEFMQDIFISSNIFSTTLQLEQPGVVSI